MSQLSQVIDESRKIIIKIGSNVLSTSEGRVNREIVANIVNQVRCLMDRGKQVILVSSGAGIFGVGAIGKWSRRKDMNYKQALCAIGQVELMEAYKELFASHEIFVAQMLLTREDFNNEDRTLHMRNTMFTLVDEGVVPIINENDTVSVDEIKIGDNDTLSALAANLWNADALVILSDIDGIFDRDPKVYKGATLIQEVFDIDGLEEEIDIHGISSFGTGGIGTKIQAARTAGNFGIATVLLNGKKKDIILKAVDDEERGTVFLSKSDSR